MSVQVSENFGDLLDARIKKIYTNEIDERIKLSMIPMLFGMESSTRAYEIVSGMGAMGDLQDFDGTISYDTVSQLYDKTFTFPEKALGFKVERKLYDDDLFGVMDRRPWGMAVSSDRTREKTGAGVFNGAFIGTDGPDDLPLCSASHPYSPDDATTQSNAGATAMSAVSIEATRRLGHTSVFNDRGELLSINYDTILCTVANEETGYEVINSSGKVDTADNNKNFHKGRYNLATWDRLTDSNDWFMLDSQLCKKFLLWYDRVKDGIKMDQDSNTLVAMWYVYERYCASWADWRPIYGHAV